ncbi:putative ribonuclease H protein [Vitis vinifera]|uniref:Putative ribonuclease H protein n=1 Tax=Vitis vinifera TaxID=29760 RepID=A0A438JUQ8_VITVI|nr:putative ribonuclease H protein [Vitis vinifera]
MWFEAISRLKVNLSKTEAIPVGEDILMETLASVLGCKIGSLPTSYLGLPLGAPYKSTRVWDVVEERFRKRLSLWKMQYLSKGDRLTLLKSTLSSLPTYFLSLFLIPKRVCARLEKIQRDFLWGGGALENRPHLVSWKVICAAKKDGGLGIRSLAIFNKALLGKWLWRFANENESLWKQIISRKYDLQDGGWCSKGKDTRVKFWKDLWYENQSLEDAFPILFNLSINKEGWVVEAWEEDGVGKAFPILFNLSINKEGWVTEAWEKDGVGSSWGLRFNRHLNDWEVGKVKNLLNKLHPLTIRRGVDDLLQWKENKNGIFSVKASFFGWEAAWSRLLTIDQMKRFGWSIPNRCYLCKNEEETIDHLLLFCEKAKMLWLMIFSLFGVQWVMHYSVRRNLLGWHGSFVGKKREKAWRAALLYLMWTIWKERNRKAFDEVERNDQEIKSIFLYTFVNWARVYIEEHTFSLIDFVDWLAIK